MPNRKPTRLKIIEGNRGKRPLPENEPMPKAKAPKCPPDISPTAKRAWNRLAPKLERLGLLTEVDGDTFASLCQIRAHLVTIHRRLRRKDQPLVIVCEKTDKNGNTWTERKPNPYVILEKQFYRLFRPYAADFGLTPRGRVGLAASGKEIISDDDDGM